MVDDRIKSALSANERVLWSGQPRQGVVIRGSDAAAIPFSLFWAGFAVFWELSVLESHASPFFVLWGIPFVLMGIYLVIGRFFVDAKRRAHTFYAVTHERVLIVSGVFTRKVKSLSLRSLSELSLGEIKGDQGTIGFGGGSTSASMFGNFSGWPGMSAQLEPRFELISDAKAVFEVIREAQRDA